MVILGEYERSENMNSLGALFGVHFSDGVLAHPNKLGAPVVLCASYTDEAVEKHSAFNRMQAWGYGVSVPTLLRWTIRR